MDKKKIEFLSMVEEKATAKKLIKQKPKERPVPTKPVRIGTAIDTLEHLGFDPLEKAVKLYELQEQNEEYRECRMLLDSLLEYAYPKMKSVHATHEIKAIDIVYQDILDVKHEEEPLPIEYLSEEDDDEQGTASE